MAFPLNSVLPPSWILGENSIPSRFSFSYTSPGSGPSIPSEIYRRTSTDVKMMNRAVRRVKSYLNEDHDDRMPCSRKMPVCREPKKK